jgi:hypothetical protein
LAGAEISAIKPLSLSAPFPGEPVINRPEFMTKLIISLIILTACLSSLLWLNHAGISARRELRPYGLAHERFPVYQVKRTVDSYLFWKEKGVQGRIVVQVGRYLHFTFAEPPGIQEIPGIAAYHSGFDDKGVSYRNFLWVAMQKNIVREVVTVIAPEDFQKRFGGLKDVVSHEFGSRRSFTTSFPSIAEPVLLNIDASAFGSTEPAQLLDALLNSPLKADLVTCCLAEDNPDVTQAERERLLQFVRLLAQHADVTSAAPSSPSQTATP